MCSYVEDIIDDCVREITVWNKPKEHHRAIMKETMRLPVKVKPVEIDETEFDHLMKSYPDDVRQEVAEFVVEISRSSKELRMKRKAIPLMMVDPPGTGRKNPKTQSLNSNLLLTNSAIFMKLIVDFPIEINFKQAKPIWQRRSVSSPACH